MKKANAMPPLPTAAPEPTAGKIGFLTAAAVVVSNMVGTGVFTSLGFQAEGISEPLTLLLLWAVGGCIALCGAFSYAELGSALPRSGGEYHYLSRLYHPMTGFLSGWFSATAGFSAPTALAAMAFGRYFHGVIPVLSPLVLATILLISVTAVHLVEMRTSGRFQFVMTFLEVAVIVFFIICGVFLTPAPVALHLVPDARSISMIFSPAFAVSLVYVSYAYSGWNGATYIAGEIRNPSSNLPKAIFIGTGAVLVLYVLLNFVFLRSMPVSALAGKIEIGLLSAVSIFGTAGGKIMGIVIAFCLVSSVSSMILAGPRILKVMGEDYQRLSLFSRTNSRGVPWVAVLTQAGLALLMIWTATFREVMTFMGFTLALFTALSVAGVFVLRRRKMTGTYRTTGYPVTPIIFLCLNAWMIVFLLWKCPKESCAGLGVLAAGVIAYFLLRKRPEK